MSGLVYLESNKYLYKVEPGKTDTIIIYRYSKQTHKSIVIYNAEVEVYQDLATAKIITKKKYESLLKEH